MPTFYRVTFNASYVGQTIQNVVHMQDRIAQGGVPPTTQFIAEDIVANWLPSERSLHQGGFRWHSVAVSQIRSPNPMASFVAPTNLAGNGGSSQSHSASCFKVRWITNRGGRRGFGKYYIGGIEWSLLGFNTSLSQLAIDRLLGFMAAIEGRYMATDGGPVPFQMVLVHKDPNDPPDFITTAVHYPELGVQRRRNIGVGI